MNVPPELIELPSPAPGVAAYRIARSADRAAAARILDWLPSGHTIGFFDATDPETGVEPGTYFAMRRQGALWEITGGNHGWSYGVVEITQEEAVSFFHYCFPSNAGPYPTGIIVDQCITVRRDDSVWDRQWSGRSLRRRIRRIAGGRRSWRERLLGG